MKSLMQVIAEADRRLTALPRRHAKIRAAVPHSLASRLRKVQSQLSHLRALWLPVHYRCAHDNLFHCCVHKTGSQWIKSVLTDMVVFQYSGLSHFHYQTRLLKQQETRNLAERRFEKPFPARAIISPLYVTYENFADLPKAGTYRAFFVARDPRDVLVSWYFSTRNTHLVPKNRPMHAVRQRLLALPETEGLLFGIDYLNERGHFATLRSWADAEARDPNVRVFRYEDFASADGPAAFRRLFEFLDIRVPEDAFERLIGAYSFERLTKRRPGTEDTRSHLRSGSPGSWRKRFDASVEARFREVTGDLVERLGYEPAETR
jgi:hypothetical protein